MDVVICVNVAACMCGGCICVEVICGNIAVFKDAANCGYGLFECCSLCKCYSLYEYST